MQNPDTFSLGVFSFVCIYIYIIYIYLYIYAVRDEEKKTVELTRERG